METQLIVETKAFFRTIQQANHGRIRGVIQREEQRLYAFLPEGDIIGLWCQVGCYTAESILPLSVRINSRGRLTEASFEGRPIPSDQVQLVDMGQVLGSRQGQLIDIAQLRRSTVLILGAGTVGSLAADNLVREGVTRFILIDKDVVEPSNLSRTCFSFQDIGRAKVKALASHLQRIQPQVEVKAFITDVRAISRQDWHRIHRQASIALIAIDDVQAQVVLCHQLSRWMPVVVAVLEAGGDSGEVTYVTSHTKPFCCVTNIKERLGAAPRGVSGAQGLVTDATTVVTQAVNTMVQLLHDTQTCQRFPQPLNPDENLLLVGRGDSGGILQANLNRRGTLSSVRVDTSRRATPCPYCRKDD